MSARRDVALVMAEPDANEKLREALVTLARQKPRYGYRRLWVILTRRGWDVNVKRIYRLYREEGSWCGG